MYRKTQGPKRCMPHSGVHFCIDTSILDGYLSRNERMTNQSLRERFRFPEGKNAITSKIISLTIDAGKIKPDEKFGASHLLM